MLIPLSLFLYPQSIPQSAQQNVKPVHSRATAQAEAEPDNAVVNAVLLDLLTYTGDDSPVLSSSAGFKTPKTKNRPPAYIRVELHPFLTRDTYGLARYESGVGCQLPLSKRLTPEIYRAASEAMQSLNSRISAKTVPATFVFSNDRRIILPGKPVPASLAKQSSPFENTGRSIYVAPPGYSNDGKTAFVVFLIPWSIHYAEEGVILTKREGKWVVVERRFLYFV